MIIASLIAGLAGSVLAEKAVEAAVLAVATTAATIIVEKSLDD